MFKINFFLGFILIGFITGCNNNNSKTIQENSAGAEWQFDSTMNVFAKEKKYLPTHIINPHDTSRYSAQFLLLKRLYIPTFYGLTFELRQLSRTSADLAQLIYVYNDSTKFILPFFEPEYFSSYNPQAAKGSVQPSEFGRNFATLVKTLHLTKFDEIVELSDIIMGMLNARMVMSKADYHAAEILIREKTRTIDTACYNSLTSTLKTLENFEKNRSICFVDGAILYRLNKNGDDWTIEIINPGYMVKLTL